MRAAGNHMRAISISFSVLVCLIMSKFCPNPHSSCFVIGLDDEEKERERAKTILLWSHSWHICFLSHSFSCLWARNKSGRPSGQLTLLSLVCKGKRLSLPRVILHDSFWWTIAKKKKSLLVGSHSVCARLFFPAWSCREFGACNVLPAIWQKGRASSSFLYFHSRLPETSSVSFWTGQTRKKKERVSKYLRTLRV